jgi:acyl-CoA thioesterase I
MSFMPITLRSAPPRSYGKAGQRVQTIARLAAVTIACAAPLLAHPAQAFAAPDRPIKIVALGDSLTAGFGLPADAAFPAKLEKALKAKGLAVEIINAGVSGDTSSGGLARLDWSIPDATDAVIVELGANDALRGVDPRLTHAALDLILQRLKERNIAVLLCGMSAPPNMGADYARAFDAIFPKLAAQYDAVFYPFFLEGIATNRTLTLPDGIHPTATAIDLIVERIMPKMEELVAKVRIRRGS